MTPAFLVGLGNQLLWRYMGETPSLWYTALGANVIWGIPFSFLVMLAVWNRYDRHIEEAARDLGANAATTFREVTLPLVWTGHLRQLPVRLHPDLERLRPDDPAAERLPGAAAADPDRHLAVQQADPPQPLRARGRHDRGDAVPDLLRAHRRHAPPALPRRAGAPGRGGVRRRGRRQPRRRAGRRSSRRSSPGASTCRPSSSSPPAARSRCAPTRRPASSSRRVSGEELVDMLAWPEAPPLELDDFVRRAELRHARGARALARPPGDASTPHGPTSRGVVVTHGTDTMEETRVPRSTCCSARTLPVVLTGAQRGADEPDTDGPRNLRDAIRVAAAPQARGRGAVIAFGGEIHAAREVRKVHTSSVRAFGSPGYGPIGVRRRRARRLPAPAPSGEAPLPVPDRLARVDLIRLLRRERRALPARVASSAGAARHRARGHWPRERQRRGRGGCPRRRGGAGSTSPSARAAPQDASQPVYGRGGGRDLAEAGALFAGDLAGAKARVPAAGRARRRPRPCRGRSPPRQARRPWPTICRGSTLREVVGDLVEGRPAHAVVPVDVLDDPLVHQQHLRAAAHVGMDRHREDGVVVLAVDPVELVAPDLLDVARIDEAVAVRRRLDEHHRRQVVEVPARRDLDQVGLLAALRAASSTRSACFE